MFTIGITGLMDTGKSTFSKLLQLELPNSKLINMDDFILNLRNEMFGYSDEPITMEHEKTHPEYMRMIPVITDRIISEAETFAQEGGTILIIEGTLLTRYPIWKACNRTFEIQATLDDRFNHSKYVPSLEEYLKKDLAFKAQLDKLSAGLSPEELAVKMQEWKIAFNAEMKKQYASQSQIQQRILNTTKPAQIKIINSFRPTRLEIEASKAGKKILNIVNAKKSNDKSASLK